MGINWRGAIRGAAEGVANVSQLMITDHVQQKRDANLARYQQEAQQAGFAHDRGMQEQQLVAQGVMQERKMLAEQTQAEIEREQELADAAVAREHAFALESHKGSINPSGTTVNVNTTEDRQNVRENARARALGEKQGGMDAKRQDAVIAAVDAAPAIEDALRVMEQLSKAYKTGTIPKLVAEGGKYFGTDAATALQTWDVSASPIIFGVASQLAGVLSETDMQIVLRGVADFGKAPAANAVAIDLMRKGIERARENEESMDAYIKIHGDLEGWRAPNKQGKAFRAETAQDGTRPADDPLGAIDDAFRRWDSMQGGM